MGCKKDADTRLVLSLVCKFSVQVYRPDCIESYRTPIWELDVWSLV